MFGIGLSELILIAIVALVFLGPEKLYEAALFAGKILGEIQKAGKELKNSIVEEALKTGDKSLDSAGEKRTPDE
jgi:sec-independent protein translocase protein TatB